MLTATGQSPGATWLTLLCWDEPKAGRLKEIVEEANFEPHPASGEIELGDIASMTYKRFDEETLRCRVVLADWNMTAIYLWCPGGDQARSEWKLAELLPTEQESYDKTWSNNITEANESSKSRIYAEAMQASEAPRVAIHAEDDGDDDDYWAQYDKTPGRTPANHRSPAPNSTQQNGQSEGEYYAQYGNVQPAMDSDDPDEKVEGMENSTLEGDTLHGYMRGQSNGGSNHNPLRLEDPGEDARNIAVPQPGSPSSASSDAIARLEASAELQSASEIGIRQHISTTFKSMYRLAKTAGMDREEFERIVQREIETLSLLDRDQ